MYAGTTSNEIYSVPTYGGCTAFGLTAHIETSGCAFRFLSWFPLTGLEIFCAGAITVKPTAGGMTVCTIDIGSQSLGVSFSNWGGFPEDMRITPVPEWAVDYTVTYPSGSGTKCGPPGNHYSGGVYTGSFTVKAFSDAAHTTAVSFNYK